MHVQEIKIEKPDIFIGERRIWERELTRNNLPPAIVTVKRIVYRCEENEDGFCIEPDQIWCEFVPDKIRRPVPERVWFMPVTFEKMELA